MRARIGHTRRAILRVEPLTAARTAYVLLCMYAAYALKRSCPRQRNNMNSDGSERRTL